MLEGMKDCLYILDSYGLIYRSYYAFINRPLTNTRGENVSAVFGFFRSLKSALDYYKPAYFAAAFDSVVPTFRHDMYPAYKATRAKTPEDLHAQIPIIEEILHILGIPVARQNGFEADDVIATLVRQYGGENRSCRILSSDKDLMQLITSDTEMVRPNKAGGWEMLGAAGVWDEWGVPPEKMLDLLSLTGDTSDNVPGVAGIGIKTAQKLLETYGTLDNIYEHAQEISGAMGKKIRDGRESAYFSRSLIALRQDVPLKVDFGAFATAGLDYAKAAEAFAARELPTIAKQYSPEEDTEDTVSLARQNSYSKPVTAGFGEQHCTAFKKNSGNYRAITDTADLADFIGTILAQEPCQVAFDLETNTLDTHNAQIVGFSLCNAPGNAVYVPLILSDTLLTDAVVSKNDAKTQLERLFSSEKAIFAMHNGKFDYEVLRSNGIKPPRPRIFDTMVAAWLLEPDRVHYGLESLGLSKLGLETISYREVVPKGKTFADVLLENAVPYAAEDADLTLRLMRYYEPRLQEAGLGSLFYDIEMPLLPVLAEMEIQGIHIEKDELARYGAELEKEIQGSQERIFKLVGHEFNISSTRQLQEVLFVERGLKTGKKIKTGYSTDTAVLEELAALDPVPRKILEYRIMAKLKSTYVDALPLLVDKNDRVHTSFVQVGTATGRLSSRDPNLQNIPVRDEAGRRIRKAFSAEPGKQLISADYAQIELVILAHLSRDENLCRAFRNGVDVHKATAALIFGTTGENVTADMRRVAKTINFGVMYGMGAFRLSNELGIPRAQAQTFLDAYNATYAGVQKYFTQTILHAEETGCVETIFGRRRRISQITSKNRVEKNAAERIAKNTPIQGSAADIVKKAMLAVDRELSAKKSPARLLLQVHDELIFECPQESAGETAALVRRVMEDVVTLNVPLHVSVETGVRWGDFH
jgi:DNA polymerase-1